MSDVKEFLEQLYAKFNDAKYAETDPIIFPHTFEGDREFIAFTAALFAYGNVKAIKKFLTNFFTVYGTDPRNLNLSDKQPIKYRFQTSADIYAYCQLMQCIYAEHKSLENIFSSEADPIKAGINGINTLLDKLPYKTNGLRFLFALPGSSTSKRLHMFFRWMIRKDNIDFGIWSAFKPAVLSMPMDTHIARMATQLGIITNESGVKALQKINHFFRELNPTDPTKYDFALTRLGIANNCKYCFSATCNSCSFAELCVFN